MAYFFIRQKTKKEIALCLVVFFYASSTRTVFLLSCSVHLQHSEDGHFLCMLGYLVVSSIFNFKCIL